MFRAIVVATFCAAAVAGCNDMECVKGHSENVKIAAYTETIERTMDMSTGRIMEGYPYGDGPFIPMPAKTVNHPERTESKFICDAWQKKS
jgi:hypothetical protein